MKNYYILSNISQFLYDKTVSDPHKGVNTSDYLRVAGGGGVHWATYGSQIEGVDGNTIRFRSGGAGTSAIGVATNEGTLRGYLYGDNANNFGLLHHGGGWAIRSNSGRNIYLNETEGNTFIGTASGSEKLNVNGWVSVQNNHGYYFATHGGGIQMTDSTWLRVYNGKGFLVDNQVRATDFRATSGSYIVNTHGGGLVGQYSDVRYQGVFSMGESYMLDPNGTALNNHYGIAWTHSNIGGQSKPVGHQMLVTEAGVTQTAIGKGIWTIADIYAQGKIEAPAVKATSKMVIPTSAPAVPENGCIWIG
ncbi:MAG: shufflon system plasmid conjugative transfer pilus tip adhesin PilV [Pedobacter sp.]|nr:MAG: shufflon system plasmid conjugative transfer pilus tip adhesin PilV [Pedobacter sp.]